MPKLAPWHKWFSGLGVRGADLQSGFRYAWRCDSGLAYCHLGVFWKFDDLFMKKSCRLENTIPGRFRSHSFFVSTGSTSTNDSCHLPSSMRSHLHAWRWRKCQWFGRCRSDSDLQVKYSQALDWRISGQSTSYVGLIVLSWLLRQ